MVGGCAAKKTGLVNSQGIIQANRFLVLGYSRRGVLHDLKRVISSLGGNPERVPLGLWATLHLGDEIEAWKNEAGP